MIYWGEVKKGGGGGRKGTFKTQHFLYSYDTNCRLASTVLKKFAVRHIGTIFTFLPFFPFEFVIKFNFPREVFSCVQCTHIFLHSRMEVHEYIL